MKTLCIITASLLVPAVCHAHSGAVFRAAAGYLPFIAPILIGGIAAVGDFFRKFLGEKTAKNNKEKSV